MKSFILIFSAILLFSCASQKTVLKENNPPLLKKTNKGMKMFGKIVVKSTPSSDGQTELPKLYFDDGTTYVINFLESNVSESEVQKHIYKEIDIVGEIKLGNSSGADNQIKGRGENNQKGDGTYIVIYKIID